MDEITGEPLIGANIYDDGLNVGTASNNYGFFSISANIPASDQPFRPVSPSRLRRETGTRGAHYRRLPREDKRA